MPTLILRPNAMGDAGPYDLFEKFPSDPEAEGYHEYNFEYVNHEGDPSEYLYGIWPSSRHRSDLYKLPDVNSDVVINKIKVYSLVSASGTATHSYFFNMVKIGGSIFYPPSELGIRYDAGKVNYGYEWRVNPSLAYINRDDISFTGPDTIQTDGNFEAAGFKVGDIIHIYGSTNPENIGLFTILSVVGNTIIIVVEEALVNEEAESGKYIEIGIPWTWTDICNLQIGLRARTETKATFDRCYLEVTHSYTIPFVSTQIATDLVAFSVTGNGTLMGEGDTCTKYKFQVKKIFEGTLEEYSYYTRRGFVGDIVYDEDLDLWKGDLIKEYHFAEYIQSNSITFTAPDTIVVSGDDFEAKGFAAGNKIKISGTHGGANDGLFTIASVSGNTIITNEKTIVDKAPGISVLIEKCYFKAAYAMTLDGLISNDTYVYRFAFLNEYGWGYGNWIEFTTDVVLVRSTCTRGVFTILLCASITALPPGHSVKRRGFKYGLTIGSVEYDVHEDGNFGSSASIGPVDTISFVKSGDPDIRDTIIDSGNGFIDADLEAGMTIDISATGEIDPDNEGQLIIYGVTAGTLTLTIKNKLVSEAVNGVTIKELYYLYIVDLSPETVYYNKAYIVVEDNLGEWNVYESEVIGTETIVNPWDLIVNDKRTFYTPEGRQNYRKLTREISAEVIADQVYIDRVGGKKTLKINNHLIQDRVRALEIAGNYKDIFKIPKVKMTVSYPTPLPYEREDTLDFGFGRIRFKNDGKGIVNFRENGKGLMRFRYRTITIIRKINLGVSGSETSRDYVAVLELEQE